MVRRAPLWACLREAFLFVPKAWAGAWLVLSLFALAVGGLLVPLRYDPFTPSPGLLALWLLGVSVLKLATYGGLFRLALFGNRARAEGLGLGGLQIGPPELRMLGGAALVLLFLAIVGVGLLVAVTLISAAASGEEGRSTGVAAWVVRGVQVLASLVLATLYVRLSLFAPATVGRRRVVSLDALGLAQGAFWTLLLGLVVCMAPGVIAAFASSGLIHGGPEIAAAAAGGLVALLVFVEVPLIAGFLAAVYKHKEYLETAGGPSHGTGT
jgi:hypothetical protein